QQPTGLVDLVYRRAEDRHGAGPVVRRAHVAVYAVQQQRCPDPAAVQRFLQRQQSGIVAAHEPDADQGPPGRRLRVEDPLAARHPATVGASGFSHSTGLPASRQASTNSSWVWSVEATRTASTASSRTSSSGSASTRVPGTESATASARGRSTSKTAPSEAPAM